MNEIAVIIVRLGKFDNYINFWANSAKNNENIDFFIYTDDEFFIKEHKNTKNFILKLIDVKTINEKVSKLCGFKFSLKKPYKLCDLKPAYGLMFKDDIKKYKYWGYCDTDLIFGNIMDFIKPLLNKYDRLYDLGHFCLFKNQKKINEVFLKNLNPSIPHLTFEMVCLEEENIYFDEYFGLNIIWANEKDLKSYINYSDYSDAYTFSLPLRRTDSKQKFFYHYLDGKLYECDSKSKREILYLHLQKRSMKILGNFCLNDYYVLEDMFINKPAKDKIIQKFNTTNLIKNILYFIIKKIKHYKERLKRKKYIKTKAKTKFYKISY